MSDDDKVAVSKLDTLFGESIKGKTSTTEAWTEAKPKWVDACAAANQQAAKRGIKEIPTGGYASPLAGVDALGKLIGRLVAYDIQSS
jgi:hypothetical protein